MTGSALLLGRCQPVICDRAARCPMMPISTGGKMYRGICPGTRGPYSHGEAQVIVFMTHNNYYLFGLLSQEVYIMVLKEVKIFFVVL